MKYHLIPVIVTLIKVIKNNKCLEAPSENGLWLGLQSPVDSSVSTLSPASADLGSGRSFMVVKQPVSEVRCEGCNCLALGQAFCFLAFQDMSKEWDSLLSLQTELSKTSCFPSNMSPNISFLLQVALVSSTNIEIRKSINMEHLYIVSGNVNWHRHSRK